jgi:hypothetical protein
MNIRRGFRRIVIVLAIGYVTVGGLWLYGDWNNQKSRREFEYSRCLDAVRDPGESAIRLTQSDCVKYHPVPTESSEITTFLMIPALLTVLGK